MLFSRVLSENWRKKIHFLIAYVMDIKIAAVWNISQKKKILSLKCDTGVGVKLSWLQIWTELKRVFQSWKLHTLMKV